MDFTLYHKSGKPGFSIASDDSSTMVGVHGTGESAVTLNGGFADSSIQALDKDGKLRVALSSGGETVNPGFVLDALPGAILASFREEQERLREEAARAGAEVSEEGGEGPERLAA